MIAGDLVLYLSERWLVVRVDEDFHTALLVNQAGRRVEVADALEEEMPEALQVVANPASQWPLVALPTKRLTGPVVTITIPNPTVRDRVLEAWVEWVPADPVREGGTLYFHPDLRLRQGVVLVATFKSGVKSRITIPKNFGTVSQRKTQSNVPKFLAPEEKNRFNRDRDVLGEDD